MTNRFLISAAVAALIAGTGFANAQGAGTSREGASGGAATQQTAPPSGGAMNRDSGAPGMKGAESTDTKAPDSAKTKASQSNEKMPASKSAQDTKSPAGEKSKSISAASILAAATVSSISKQWSSTGRAAEFPVHHAFIKQT